MTGKRERTSSIPSGWSQFVRRKPEPPKEESKHQQQQPQGFVYVLQLEHDKYYVGFTRRDHGERFHEHFDDIGAKWTKKYKPKQLLEFQPGTPEDEDRITLNMMRAFGWWNVRGGKWCAVDMRRPPIELGGIDAKVRDKVHAAMENKTVTCTRCKRSGHALAQCYAKVDGVPRCVKCGFEGHVVADCQANDACVIM